MSAERSYEFVDTSTLVYAHDISSGEKHRVAKSLVVQLWDLQRGCLSIQVLQELYVTLTQKLVRSIEPRMARQIVADLSLWRVHVPNAQDVLEAIDIQQDCQVSFWDAMIIQSASRLGCSTLWAEDLTHGYTYGKVHVLNPFA